jgi:hypothetical protein
MPKQDRYKARRINTGEWVIGYLAYSETENKYFMHICPKGAEPKHKLYNVEVDGENREKI